MRKNKKVYVYGTDKIGWSIDKDRMYTIKAINSLEGFQVTNSYFDADIIYVVWWNELLKLKFRFINTFFNKKIIACITNDLTHQEGKLKKVLSSVDIFVYANSNQRNKLLELGIDKNKMFFNPFYVDETLFKSLNLSKKELSQKLNIDYEIVKNKYLIGSFQRDSLGSDLTQQKWQKDPDMLVDIFNFLNKKDYLLLLAGPRRHYLVNKCKEYNIPYLFIGEEKYITNQQDDLLINAIDITEMPYLYNLIDLYIVSSKSEGGPKAIPEAILCDSNIISTDVGFATDLLDERLIYSNAKEGSTLVEEMLNDVDGFKNKVGEYYRFSYFQRRIKDILMGV